MNHITTKLFFVLLIFFSTIAKANELEATNPMILHPEWYIKVNDWSYYAAFKVAIISHVTIENTADISYKNIEIKLNFYSTTNAVGQVGSTTGFLPITISPHSKQIYLIGGTPLGSGTLNYRTNYVQVLGAVPIVKDSLKKYLKRTTPKLTL